MRARGSPFRKSRLLSKGLEFKNQNHVFQVRVGDVVKFESALNEENIPHHREENNIGAFYQVYPLQTYYFKTEDVNEVDIITKRLGLVNNPYMDVKPFWWFEVKAYVIGFIAIVVLMIIYSIASK